MSNPIELDDAKLLLEKDLQIS